MIVEFFNLDKVGVQPVAALLHLCAKHIKRKVLLLCEDQRQAAHLDKVLWSYDPESFLPHGLATEDDAAHEPVLLGTDLKNPNNAKVLILAYNPPAGWLPPKGFELVVELIPLSSGAGLTACRNRYRELSQKATLQHTTSLV